MNATAAWQQVQPSQETQAHLHGYVLWARLLDGEHIFTLAKVGTTPGDGDGGYRSVAACLQVRGWK